MPDSDAYGAESAPPFFSLILFVVVSLCLPARAHDALPEIEFNQTLHGYISFSEVEMVARNHAIGLYRGGKVRLQPWVAVSDQVSIGVDQEGRLLQIVTLLDEYDESGKLKRQGRTLGFVLGPSQKIDDLFFAAPGLLIAIGRSGEVFSFSWDLWRKSKLPGILKRAGLITGATVCGVGAITYVSACYLGLSPLSHPMLIQFFGLVTTTVGIQSFFVGARYESENETPNGLIADLGRVDNYKSSSFVRGRDGRIVDYILYSDKGRSSLRELIGSSFDLVNRNQSFQKTCEHDLLPRGIPPKRYEP